MIGDHIDPPSRPPAQSAGVDADLDARPTWRDRLRTLWNALVGGIGFLLGLLPHVLHHVGFLAGTALVAGSGGYGALRCAGISRLSSVSLASAPTVRDLARAGHRAADLCRDVLPVGVRHRPGDQRRRRRRRPRVGVGTERGAHRASRRPDPYRALNVTFMATGSRSVVPACGRLSGAGTDATMVTMTPATPSLSQFCVLRAWATPLRCPGLARRGTGIRATTSKNPHRRRKAPPR